MTGWPRLLEVVGLGLIAVLLMASAVRSGLIVMGLLAIWAALSLGASLEQARR